MSTGSTSRIGLLMVDLDGTLIGPSMAPAADDIEALRRAIDSGVLVAIATGRPLASAERLLDDLPGLAYLLPSNGAAIVDAQSRHVRWTAPGFSTGMLGVLAALAPRYAVTLAIYTATRWYVTAFDERVALEASRAGVRPEVVADRRQIREPVVKVMYIGPADSLAALRAELEAMVDDVRPTGTYFSDYLDVSPAGVSKGAACRRLMAHTGLDRARVMAIGDGENDVSMLAEAGIAVALRDGCARLVEVATHLTVGCGDGAVGVATNGLVFGDEEARRRLWRRVVTGASAAVASSHTPAAAAF
jgi:Cof subfamily protein (haloacid dehalogenase superfamily)